MNSGSCFLAEISWTTSSLSPGGSVSASMSLTKPHLYSRLARASRVLVVVLMDSFFARLRRERRAASTARLGAGVEKREATGEALRHVVERGVIQVEIALLVADHAHAVDLELPVVGTQLVVELELVRQARAAAAPNAH